MWALKMFETFNNYKGVLEQGAFGFKNISCQSTNRFFRFLFHPPRKKKSRFFSRRVKQEPKKMAALAGYQSSSSPGGVQQPLEFGYRY